ncbi:MAG: hypothetical protein C0490_07490 [Marivirga sp.]|nr:hypothetical protein [Marivirga sp.]
MKIKSNKTLPAIVFTVALAACSGDPKVIAPTATTSDADNTTSIFSQDQPPVIPDDAQSELATNIHKVTVLEVLPTARYIYLRVRDEQDEFWIATIKREVVVGATYFYQGGLLKTNFESREHKRTFDKIYLVSSIIEAEHSAHAAKQEIPTHSDRSSGNSLAAGTTRIGDLVAEPRKYEGKIIQVSGQCVNINPNIMGRNWVHLRDGSGNNFDLVITCDVEVPVGHQVTMTGRVVLNRDFGSGYAYSILLEEGSLAP